MSSYIKSITQHPQSSAIAHFAVRNGFKAAHLAVNTTPLPLTQQHKNILHGVLNMGQKTAHQVINDPNNAHNIAHSTLTGAINQGFKQAHSQLNQYPLPNEHKELARQVLNNAQNKALNKSYSSMSTFFKKKNVGGKTKHLKRKKHGKTRTHKKTRRHR